MTVMTVTTVIVKMTMKTVTRKMMTMVEEGGDSKEDAEKKIIKKQINSIQSNFQRVY